MEKGTILIFGMPRSGTTWLGKLFDSHPSTLYRHEPDSGRRLDDVLLFPSPADANYLGSAIQTFESSLADIAALKVCGKTPVFPKKYLSAVQFRLYQAGIRASQLAAQVGINIPIFGAPQRLDSSSRLVWKSIESVGRLGLVLATLPTARAVLLIRHPCGYAASVMRGESQRRFQDNRGASEDYGILEMLLDTELARERDLSIEYFQSLEPDERLAWRWVLSNDKAIRDVQDTKRCRIVRYEDLCADPLQTMQDNFEFSGLDWSVQTEEFIAQSTIQDDGSYYSVFKDPKKAAERWREELDPDCIERILAVVNDTVPGSMFVDSDHDSRS